MLLTAPSMARTMSSPGRYPAFSMALRMASTASAFFLKAGAKPPSSPTPVVRPPLLRILLRTW